MTALTKSMTTFAFYETIVAIPAPTPTIAPDSSQQQQQHTLVVPSYQSMAFTVFLDGVEVGHKEDTDHGFGNQVTFNISLTVATRAAGSATKATAATAKATLTILAEELGYCNYGFKTQVKKGIDRAGVTLDGVQLPGEWKQRGGLSGEWLEIMTNAGASKVPWSDVAVATTTTAGKAGTWFQTNFTTPAAITGGAGTHAQLLLNAAGMNRGRFWVNGHDVGRYWLLERNDFDQCPKLGEGEGGASEQQAGRARACATQTFYHIPTAWLAPSAEKGGNLLTVFEAAGTDGLPQLAEQRTQGVGNGNGNGNGNGSGSGIHTLSLAYSSMKAQSTTASIGNGAVTVDPTKVVSCEF
jgi:hypothetical protein